MNNGTHENTYNTNIIYFFICNLFKITIYKVIFLLVGFMCKINFKKSELIFIYNTKGGKMRLLKKFSLD